VVWSASHTEPRIEGCSPRAAPFDTGFCSASASLQPYSGCLEAQFVL
jgi:hypothetical protein